MIPVQILTGFLGSGKTTLLARLLADPAMGDTAVLINELGEVGIDHLLVRRLEEDVVLLESGCLCCTVRNELVETLADLAARRAAGDLPAFRRIVIETTGLADPAPIVHTLMTDARLVPHMRLAGLTTTVDATHGEATLATWPEAVKQAAMADRLVMTKTDLTEPFLRERLWTRLAALNPAAQRFEASRDAGPSPAALFEGEIFGLDARNADVNTWLAAEAAASHDHHAHRLDAHHDDESDAHAPDRHSDRVASFCLRADAPLDWPTLTQWLELLLAARGEQILRLKGVLNVRGRTRPVVVHGVQHVLYPPEELLAWPDDDHASRLVFITRDLTRSAVERSFARVVAGVGRNERSELRRTDRMNS
ncbi:MAG: GTP-binding protein [Rhodoplanes sp.]|uniref:CobW family GTP-binding protein n=1 Tax=Rhodoplanes sp. TaxID=1968906 RepID=UPI001804857A|nr:GTP-binding protein [Rhodoplanes sp.]NVO12467.1 GTP-binding protein [Rhodoplanes sp.]